MYTQQVAYVPTIEGSYYNDLKYYLQHGKTPDHPNAKQKKSTLIEIPTISIVPWNSI